MLSVFSTLISSDYLLSDIAGTFSSSKSAERNLRKEKEEDRKEMFKHLPVDPRRDEEEKEKDETWAEVVMDKIDVFSPFLGGGGQNIFWRTQERVPLSDQAYIDLFVVSLRWQV